MQKASLSMLSRTINPIIKKRAIALHQQGMFDSVLRHPRIPDEPFFHLYVARTGIDIRATGTDFESEERALIRVLSESYERLLWKSDHVLTRATPTLSTPPRNALLPSMFAGYSKEQQAQYPFLVQDDGTPLRWIKGANLTGWGSWHCPLQVTSGAYTESMYHDETTREPLIRSTSTNGVASHTSYVGATLAGLLELIERDAFAITFANTLAAPRLDIGCVRQHLPRLATIIERFTRSRLRVELILLPTDFPVHVVLACVIDETGQSQALSMGARASFSLETAVEDALREAAGLRYSLRTTIDLTNPENANLSPYAVHLRKRLSLWTHMEQLSTVDFLWSGPYLYPPQQPQPKTPREQLRILTTYMRSQHMTGCVIDLSHKSPYSCDLHAVQVVVPELQPLQLGDEPPYLGGSRLRKVPHQLGFTPREILYDYPHPFP
jgi:ribosomal protein S12 methylthiotransferase accessory factor